MTSGVESAIKNVNEEASKFAAIKDEASYDKEIAVSSEQQAQNLIQQASDMVQSIQFQRDQLQADVMNPEMQEKSLGGKSGGMTEVVNQEKLQKDTAALKATETQLAAAKAKANEAKDGALAAIETRVNVEATEAQASQEEQNALAKVSILRTALVAEERKDEVDVSKDPQKASAAASFSSAVSNITGANNTNNTNGQNQDQKNSDQKVNQATASSESNTD